MTNNTIERFSGNFGLIRAPSKQAVNTFVDWQTEIMRQWDFSVELSAIIGDLSSLLASLRPLVSPIRTKYLFIPTRSEWTIFLDNGVNGTDAASPMPVLSSKLQVDTMRVTISDERKDKATRRVTQYGAVIWEYYAGGKERRTVFSANDGGKWKFMASGEAFDFENLEAYKSRRLSDRLTAQMLIKYLAELGIDFTDEQLFVRNEEHPAYLVRKIGTMPSNYREYA